MSMWNHKDGKNNHAHKNEIMQKLAQVCVCVCVTVRVGLKQVFQGVTLTTLHPPPMGADFFSTFMCSCLLSVFHQGYVMIPYHTISLTNIWYVWYRTIPPRINIIHVRVLTTHKTIILPCKTRPKVLTSKVCPSICRIWCNGLQGLSKYNADDDIIMVTGLSKQFNQLRNLTPDIVKNFMVASASNFTPPIQGVLSHWRQKEKISRGSGNTRKTDVQLKDIL